MISWMIFYYEWNFLKDQLIVYIIVFIVKRYHYVKERCLCLILNYFKLSIEDTYKNSFLKW